MSRNDGNGAAGPGVRAATDADGELSLLSLANLLLRHWQLLVGVPAIALIVALTGYVLRPQVFQAESIVKPQGADMQSGRLATIAAQFGVPIGGINAAGESADFYAALVNSRELLRAVAATEYSATRTRRFGAADTLRGTIAQLYGIRGETVDEQNRLAVGELSRNVSASVNPVAGVIAVHTRAPWPDLAEAINHRILELLNEFNLQRRQSQAREERAFVERRLEEAQQELRVAEGALERFHETNRRFTNSPELTLELQRLQRTLDLRQQLYVSLAQSAEQARIDEVRTTPVITVVDPATDSAVPLSSPLKTAMLALTLGLMLALMTIFGLEFLARQRRQHPEAYAELEGWRDTLVGRLVPLPVRRRLWRRTAVQPAALTGRTEPGA
jgi:uncharacterized protein involved in exopolysaccharide biosynthesis